MSWIENEDRALKSVFSGITVSDSKQADRPVKVWFGRPDLEVRQQSYPYITLDLIGLWEARERAHRGIVSPDYRLPDAPDPVPGHGQTMEYPVPYDFNYQVTTFARNPQHDRQIVNEILNRRFRGGRLLGLDVPEDETVRTMTLHGMVTRDRTDEERRLFSKVFTITVCGEALASEIRSTPWVSRINLTTTTTN